MRRFVPFLIALALTFPLAAAERTVGEITFLAGNWSLVDGNIIWDEQWTPPRGDSILGMCRALKDGRTFFYELLSIEQEASGPVLKLKHFKRGLIGREEKDEVVTLPLVSLTKTEAVFERADKLVRLTYRLESPDRLYALLEKWKDGKKTTSDEFRYSRVK